MHQKDGLSFLTDDFNLKPSLMKIIASLGLLLLTVVTYAQKIGVDSKGKSIFTHLSRAEARLEFSSEEPLSVSYVFNPKVTDYILTGSGDTTITPLLMALKGT